MFIAALPDSKDLVANRSGYWQKRVSGEVKGDQKTRMMRRRRRVGKNERRGI